MLPSTFSAFAKAKLWSADQPLASAASTPVVAACSTKTFATLQRLGGGGGGLTLKGGGHMPQRPPPKKKNYFLLRVCFIDEASGEYTGREVWQKLHRGGGASTRLGGMRPPNLCVMQLPYGSNRMRPRGEGPPSI